VCDNQDVTLMCHTDQTAGNMITWFWYNQSQDGDNITVVAMMTGVVFNCVAYVQGREVGKSSVTVRANGELDNQQVYPTSFYVSRSSFSLTVLMHQDHMHSR